MAAIDYRHQDTAAAFLAERRFAYLADEPGLGKTRSVVKGADKAGIRRILVSCPGVIRRVWESEFEEWQSVDRPIVVEEGFLTRSPSRDGVTIVSHAVFSHAPSRDALRAGAPYDLLVVDEARAFCQFQAARTEALYGLAGIGGLVSMSERYWAVDGSVVVNSAADLYPLMFGVLRTPVDWHDFCSHYCEMRPDAYLGVKPVGVRNAAELAAGLRPHLLRRTIASLGIEMPPLETRATALATDPAAVSRVMAGLEGWTPARLTAALEETDELRDAALSRVRRALGMAKAAAAAAHIEAVLAGGDGPYVAFFQHTDVRREMHAALAAAGRQVSWIDGTVTARQLRAAREWFQAGRLDALLVQTQAGGQGLTLTRSHRAAIVELPWTATAVGQAYKRIHRIGQTKACIGEALTAPGCWLDEVMAKVVDRKRRDGDELLALLTSDA